MTDLDNARVWAEQRAHSELVFEGAAARLIQSLPEQWVDVEKVREAISGQLSVYTRGTASHYIAEKITRNLESLLTPKLPTLADMTQEERKACVGMQAQTWHEVGIIVWVDEMTEIAQLITQNNGVLERKFKDVTPLPDLPKLEWPGGVVDCEIVDEQEPVDAPPAEKATLPKTADVPVNEVWEVICDGKEYVGCRLDWGSTLPWVLAREDGIRWARDTKVKLRRKISESAHELPEGMRLADHEEYGRVVVAPRANTHGEEYFYRLREDSAWGASHGYRPTEEFTFLGGDQHA